MADETTPAPLSDAEIAEIAALVASGADQTSELAFTPRTQVVEYMARLLATLAAYREIVAAVAQMHTNDMRRAVVGSPDLITRARALLATSTRPATDATAGEEGE